MIALVGVMIGATLAGGFDYYRDTRKDGQELRQAKRLVALQISLIGTELSVARQDKTPPDPDHL
jgi:hypothetical protein